METTKKAYNHLLVVEDGFTKFIWFYPTKSADARASSIFGNRRRIITDRAAALISQAFKYYCTEENIHRLLYTEKPQVYRVEMARWSESTK